MTRSSAKGLGNSRRSQSSVWRGSGRVTVVGRPGWPSQWWRVESASTAGRGLVQSAIHIIRNTQLVHHEVTGTATLGVEHAHTRRSGGIRCPGWRGAGRLGRLIFWDCRRWYYGFRREPSFCKSDDRLGIGCSDYVGLLLLFASAGSRVKGELDGSGGCRRPWSRHLVDI